MTRIAFILVPTGEYDCSDSFCAVQVSPNTFHDRELIEIRGETKIIDITIEIRDAPPGSKTMAQLINEHLQQFEKGGDDNDKLGV